MEITEQGDRLDITNQAAIPIRILCGLGAVFFLYKAVGHFFAVQAIAAQYGGSIFSMSGIFFLYLVLSWIFSYFASNKRVFSFAPDGIHMIFGPRIYAFFTMKKEFLPVSDIQSLVILPYRARQIGPLMYGLHVKRKSSTKSFDLFGLKNKEELLKLAERIRAKLKQSDLPIVQPK